MNLQKRYQIGLIIFFSIAFLTINLSCSKNNETDKATENEYYVKYIVNSQTAYVSGGKTLTRTAKITTENNENKSFTFRDNSWEKTIGPVKKGFTASLNGKVDAEGAFGGPSRTYINVEIQISKNNGPFALKASNISSTERFSSSTSYTINY